MFHFVSIPTNVWSFLFCLGFSCNQYSKPAQKTSYIVYYQARLSIYDEGSCYFL